MSMSSDLTVKAVDRKYPGLESEWTGSFSFVLAADTQLGLIDEYFKRGKGDWAKEIHYLKLVLQSVNAIKPRPKFFVICGDLVNAWPQTEERSSQIQDLKETLTELNPEIKIVCVSGNHDVGQKPTPQTIESYKQDFGDDYFSFRAHGCKFLVINSQLYFDSSECEQQQKDQDKWLDNELKEKAKHTVMFQHIPLFLNTSDEPSDKYFNIEPEQRKILIDKYRSAGIKKVFCGHYHQNAGGFHEDLECVVTAAIGMQLGDDKHGYRLVHVDDKEVKHEYIGISDEVN